MARLAVLCGTGMTELATSTDGAEVETFRSDTPWGEVPCTIVRITGHEILFIYRHHSPDGAVNPPHSIEHRANVHAATSFEPSAVISVWCVGSMDSDFPPGVVGVADDLLDISGTVWTFHDSSAVHVNRTEMFDRFLSSIAADVLKSQDGAGANAYRQIVGQASGPQFESRADVEAYHRLGATCVNMTIGGEARCMSEKDVRHVGLLLSSNWAAGKDPADALAPVDHHSVENLAASMRARVWASIISIAGAQ
jgi:purine nucleoside phosphorylase